MINKNTEDRIINEIPKNKLLADSLKNKNVIIDQIAVMKKNKRNKI